MTRVPRSPLLAVLLVAALAAAEPPAPGAGTQPAGEPRLVAVPLNLGVRAPAELEPGVAPVWRELLSQLQAREAPVAALERDSVALLWQEVVEELRQDAQGDDLYAVYAGVARRIAEQVPCRAVVFPSLVARIAALSGRHASWDGVRRPVPLPGVEFEAIETLPHGSIQMSRHGVRGEIGAASLHVALLSPQGELRSDRVGGLVVIEKLVEGEEGFERVPRLDAWKDTGALRDGVEALLDELGLAPTAP